MTIILKGARVITVSGLLVVACLGFRAAATPYASGVTNNGGTVSFVLNESADNVFVVTNSPEGIAGTNELGTLEKGTHSFDLGTATNFLIYVYKNTAPGWRWHDPNVNATGFTNNNLSGLAEKAAAVLQISDNSSSSIVFNSARGIAINQNPQSPYFGRVYVANSTASAVPYTNTFGGYRLGGVGDGLYVLNADLSDALGQGDSALTAGLDTAFSASGDTPYRLFLGSDDRLYICGKGAEAAANIFVADANVDPTSGTNILQPFAGSPMFPVTSANTHGGIEALWVSGSLDAGNASFYTSDQDLQTDKNTSSATQRNSLWRLKNLGWANLPSTSDFSLTWTPGSGYRTAARVSDFDRGGPNDYYYVSIWVDDGSQWWVGNSSFSGGALFTSDKYQSVYTLALAGDGASYLAAGMRSTHHVWIYPLNGVQIPENEGRALLPIGTGLTGNGTYRVRQVKFDAAYNLYVAQDGFGALRVYSPGGASMALTGNDSTGSSGSFGVQFGPAITRQPPSANVTLALGAPNSTALSVQGDYLGAAYVPTFTKQWYKDGVALPDNDPGHIENAQSATMTLTPVSCAVDSGDYYFVSANEIGAATSMVVHVTVLDPAIASQPTDQTNYTGETAQFAVTAIGAASSYEWRRGATVLVDGPTGWGSVIGGATTHTLVITNVSEADGTNGDYSVVVTGTGCATNIDTSAAVALKVLSLPTLSFYGSPEMGFNFTVPTTVSGRTYILEYTGDLSAEPWTALMSMPGDGVNPVYFYDYGPFAENQRFYRVAVQ